jgi:hypothetical protein
MRRINISRTKIGKANSGRNRVKEKKSKMDEEENRRNSENCVVIRWEEERNQISKENSGHPHLYEANVRCYNTRAFRQVGKLEHAQYYLRSSLDVRDFVLS